ncbi:MAG: hypothetical protein PHE24_04765 [Patescibacteria group bacterium]|nr:hypothetical protein [Patescibacteria group bacterium]
MVTQNLILGVVFFLATIVLLVMGIMHVHPINYYAGSILCLLVSGFCYAENGLDMAKKEILKKLDEKFGSTKTEEKKNHSAG